MRIWRFLVILLVLTLFVLSVSATEPEDILTQGIAPEDELPPEALEEIGPYEDFSSSTFGSAVTRLLGDAFGSIGGTLSQGAACCGMVLAAVLLCGLTDSAENTAGIAAIVGALAITAACTGSFSSLIQLGTQTIEKTDRYTTLLLPGLAALAATSGSVTASSSLYLGTAFFLKVLMSAIRFLMIPGVYFLTALSAAEAALVNGKLQKLREFIYWLLSGTLKLFLYLFTGFLTVTGVIAGTTDAMRLKAAKLALSGTVPVVGGIISDASDTLLTSAVTIKNTLGTYGLLAVLAICLYPFLQVAVQYLLLKLTTAVSGLIGKSCHVSLVEHLTQAMGLVVAMVGTYAMMILICITIFLKLAV